VCYIVGRRGVPLGELCIDGNIARRTDEHYIADEGAGGVVGIRVIDIGCGWLEAAGVERVVLGLGGGVRYIA
jgi:hypothetical protein